MSDDRERGFDTYAEYRECLHGLLDAATRELVLFDQDLRECGLSTEVGVERLRALIDRSPLAPCLRMIVKDASNIERDCPRLLELIARYGHKMRIRVSAREHQAIENAFAVVDGHHVLMRFHADKPRGKLSIDDARLAAQCNAQFESIWDRSTGGPSGVPLGI